VAGGGLASKSYTVNSATALKIPIFIKVLPRTGVGDYVCQVTSPGDFGGHIPVGSVKLLTVRVRQ